MKETNVTNILPHVKYIGFIGTKSETKYYLGGEEHDNLTIGKEYEIRSVSYSPSQEVKRISVIICNGDDGKICQVDKVNFGTISDLRDRKIDKIINNNVNNK